MSRFAVIALAFYFALGSLLQGYFFDAVYLTVSAILFAVLFIGAIRSSSFRWSPYHVLLLLLVAAYGVSATMSADHEQAILETAKLAGLLPIAILSNSLDRGHMAKLLNMIPRIGAFLVLIGILFGLDRNDRLESTLHYANVLAVFLLIGIVVSLWRYSNKAAITDLLLVCIQSVGLLLTLSRSVWVLWGLATVTCLIVFPSLRRSYNWLRIGATYAAAILLSMLVRQDFNLFWQRAGSIQTQTSEFQIRLVYWQDSFSIIRDYPVFGTGGGGWSALQHLYQSRDYYVKYIHNHYIQTLLDIGVIGAAVWIALLLWLVRQTLRALASSKVADENQDRQLPVVLSILAAILLLHAGFDFDFSFPLMLAWFFSFAAMIDRLATDQPTQNTSTRSHQLIRKARLAATCCILLLPLTWLSVGYTLQQSASSMQAREQLESALNRFDTAIAVIPWSSSMLYERAKVNVELGNRTGNRMFYAQAKSDLQQALQRLPDNPLYRSLLNDIDQEIFTNDS